MPAITKQTNHKVPKNESVIDRIRGIEFDANRGLKIMLYGESGTGKTTLASTFPGPILWIVTSGGKTAGELLSVRTKANIAKIKQVIPHSIMEVAELANYVRESGKFKTVIEDHVTGLQDLAITEVLGIAEIPTQKEFGMATQAQWGQCNIQCETVLRPLLDLVEVGVNVVLIGQERLFEPKEGSIGEPKIAMAATKGLVGWLNPCCDYICQTFLQPVYEEITTTINGVDNVQRIRKPGVEPKFCLRTGRHDLVTTKFRLPKGIPLPEIIEDPSYEKIVSLIKKGIV